LGYIQKTQSCYFETRLRSTSEIYQINWVLLQLLLASHVTNSYEIKRFYFRQLPILLQTFMYSTPITRTSGSRRPIPSYSQSGTSSSVPHFFYVHMTVHRNKFLFNKTNRRTNFPNLFLSRNSACFGQFLCPSSGVFHCTFGTGICHAGLMTAFKHGQCLKAVIKPA